jgi:hypothetical protein
MKHFDRLLRVLSIGKGKMQTEKIATILQVNESLRIEADKGIKEMHSLLEQCPPEWKLCVRVAKNECLNHDMEVPGDD